MRIRSYGSALVVGGLVLTGGLAAGPEESDNGCRGTNEAQQHVEEDSPAAAAIAAVEDTIDPDGDKCDNNANSASEKKGGNGDRSGG